MASLRFPTAVLAMLLLPGICAAETFEDSRTGIKLTVDDSFRVASEPVPGRPDTSMIFISSKNGHPFVPGSITPTCVLTQWQDPDFAGLTQAEINADAPNWPADVVADMMGGVALESARPFEHQGLTVMEIVTSLPLSVVIQDRLVFYALATPKARTSLSCGATSQTVGLALPAFRHIIDGLTLPQ
jgi:hypothetical protein